MVDCTRAVTGERLLSSEQAAEELAARVRQETEGRRAAEERAAHEAEARKAAEGRAAQAVEEKRQLAAEIERLRSSLSRPTS